MTVYGRNQLLLFFSIGILFLCGFVLSQASEIIYPTDKHMATVNERVELLQRDFGNSSESQVIDYATNVLELYTPKMRHPYLSVSMRIFDAPTKEMNRIAVDVAALAYFMVEKDIWLPQSEKLMPFLGLTVESLFQREFQNQLEEDSRRDDEPEGIHSFDYDKIEKDFPVIYYFSKNGSNSIPVLMDEFKRKVRFETSTDYLKASNNERRLRCVALIAHILIEESDYQPDEITPEIWHQIAGDTWREIYRYTVNEDDRFKEGVTYAFNSQMPFYMAMWASPPDPIKYPNAKRDEKEYNRIMEFVPTVE